MMASKSFIFRFEDVEVREREFSLIKAGARQAVEPKAFRVLLVLLRNPGKLVEKEELLNAVWGDVAVGDNSLARSVALLRKLLGDEARIPRFIETVATVGYRFVSPVEAVEDPSAGTIRSQRKVGRWGLAAAFALVVLLAAGFGYLYRPQTPLQVTNYRLVTHDGRSKALIGTDGNKIYFSCNNCQKNPLAAQVAVTGGETIPIPVPVKDASDFEDVSPDGSNLLIGSPLAVNNTLWNVRVPEGSLRRLPDAETAAFSPDGNSVAYFTRTGDFWVVQSDGSGARKLASPKVSPPDGFPLPDAPGKGQYRSLAWSPDGKTIRFSNSKRIWELSSSGANLHEVLPGWHSSSRQCCGRWTPDGSFYVFLDSPGGSFPQSELWALDERRGLLHPFRAEPVHLTSNGPIRWGRPVPGRDGKTIFAAGISYRGELSRLDTSTGHFEPFLGGISAQGVTYSRDGKSVAYVSYPEGILWKADRDGSNLVQLTGPPIDANNPFWSPDGSQIAFNDNSSDPWAIYLVSSVGGSPQRLIPQDKVDESDANWSADGSEIVFCSGKGYPESTSLQILDLATHHVATVPGSEGMYSPRWSPDGRFIAAMPIPPFGLKIFDVGTKQWRWLMVPGKEHVAFPEWSRDSQSLYFVGGFVGNAGDKGLYRVRLNGGEPERITDLNGFNLGGWYYRWMGLDPTDAPLVLRDLGGSDIYALTLERK
jgi:DNA-binding winged helix-turn-helix (wHTH) protein/Tol biopolymer transport system component